MYQLLFECYRSGQITESQWHEHLKDEVFTEWLKMSDAALDASIGALSGS